jgi:hypothetical protein
MSNNFETTIRAFFIIKSNIFNFFNEFHLIHPLTYIIIIILYILVKHEFAFFSFFSIKKQHQKWLLVPQGEVFSPWGCAAQKQLSSKRVKGCWDSTELAP